MAQTSVNLAPRGAFVEPGPGGLVLTRQANLFLNSLTLNANSGAAGTVTAGAGLAGGGAVADGITLSVADNGITNAMIRQAQPCSVIGRFANSTGNVSDITAVQNRVALGRQSNQVAFYPSVDVPSVICDALTINDTPAVSTATVTHSIPIETDSGTMYILLSSTP